MGNSAFFNLSSGITSIRMFGDRYIDNIDFKCCVNFFYATHFSRTNTWVIARIRIFFLQTCFKNVLIEKGAISWPMFALVSVWGDQQADWTYVFSSLSVPSVSIKMLCKTNVHLIILSVKTEVQSSCTNNIVSLTHWWLKPHKVRLDSHFPKMKTIIKYWCKPQVHTIQLPNSPLPHKKKWSQCEYARFQIVLPMSVGAI